MMALRTAIISGLLLCTQAVAAPQHALTLYDEPPKYPANFKHVDYVNPDAPKGGTFRESAMGSFDSLNPFISKGVPADNIGLVFDTLAQQGLDEPITEYGLIAGLIAVGIVVGATALGTNLNGLFTRIATKLTGFVP